MNDTKKVESAANNLCSIEKTNVQRFSLVIKNLKDVTENLGDVNKNLGDVNKNLGDVRKDTKKLAENVCDTQESHKQMEKSNEQRLAQVEECVARLQGNHANPEVQFPGELYLIYLESFHDFGRQPKKLENRTQLMSANIN